MNRGVILWRILLMLSAAITLMIMERSPEEKAAVPSDFQGIWYPYSRAVMYDPGMIVIHRDHVQIHRQRQDILEATLSEGGLLLKLEPMEEGCTKLVILPEAPLSSNAGGSARMKFHKRCLSGQAEIEGWYHL